mmetsp:Transcript_5303/g.10548  ORF Transcript_5303/g.10548 Transcript_5303/m.10548 type:complete len:132 (+) Transcript_5303:69-464(+)
MAWKYLAPLLVAMAWAQVPADVGFGLGDTEKTVEVQPGGNFTVKINDMRSTGYMWSLKSLPAGISMNSNSTGGGTDEPPFIMCKLTAAKDFKKGDVIWEHAKPWEMDNPKALKFYATLHVTEASNLDAVLV